jgi:hypothetical protein
MDPRRVKPINTHNRKEPPITVGYSVDGTTYINKQHNKRKDSSLRDTVARRPGHEQKDLKNGETI